MPGSLYKVGEGMDRPPRRGTPPRPGLLQPPVPHPRSQAGFHAVFPSPPAPLRLQKGPRQRLGPPGPSAPLATSITILRVLFYSVYDVLFRVIPFIEMGISG